jgi:translation initiation factor IF-2
MPDQTSGLQPPISAPVIAPQAVAAEPATTSSFNWADDHDDELAPPVSTLPSQAKVDEEVIGSAPIQESRPAVALVQENETTLPQVTEAVDAPSAVESATAPATTALPVPAALAQGSSPQVRKGGQGRGRGGRPPREGGREGGGGRKPGQGPREGRSAGAGAGQGVQHTAQAAENGPKVLVDEDGFELKVRRTPPVTRGGRGGRGGPGAGGERGRGAGRGRGGTLRALLMLCLGARGGARTGSGSGERAGQEGGAGAAPKSKPLFKPTTVAPVGTVPGQ